ncbi:MAG: hypothetical protein ACRC2T_06285 [Thermoguttaceae bacterium]
MTNSDNDFKNQFSFDDSLASVCAEAFRLLFELPEKSRRILVLHLYKIPSTVIAQRLQIPVHDVKTTIVSARETLGKQVSLIRIGLLKISANSPPPLNELVPLIEEAKQINLVRKRQKQRKITVKTVKMAVMPNQEQSHFAKKLFFDLDYKLREAFALTEAANMTVSEMAKLLHIPVLDAAIRIQRAIRFFATRIEKLILTVMENDHDTINALTPSELAVAKKLLESLPKEYSSIYERYVLTGSFNNTIEFGTDNTSKLLNQLRMLLGMHGSMLVVAWLRFTLNGTASLEVLDTFLNEPNRITDDYATGMGVVEYTLNLVGAEDREAFLLITADSMEFPEIAAYQEVSEEELANRIKTSWDALLARIEHILSLVKIKNYEKKTAIIPLQRREYVFSKKLLKSFSKSIRRSIMVYLWSERSRKLMADKLGMTIDEAEAFLNAAQNVMIAKVGPQVLAALHKVKDGQRVADRMYDRIRRKNKWLWSLATLDPKPSDYSAAELEEAQKAFENLDEESQELFTLKHVQEKDEFEIAAYKGLRLTDVSKRFAEIRESLRRRMASLVIGYLRNVEKPDTIRMDESAKETGKKTFSLLMEGSQEIYRRCMAYGETAEEIASILNLNKLRMEDRIESVEKYFGLRMEKMVSDWLQPKPAETPDEEYVANVPPEAVYETPTPQKRNWLATAGSVLGLLGMSKTASASTVTKNAVIPLATWLPMIGVIPFLWFMSLYITGCACGTTFILNAKTLQARQWLVKQLFQLYTLVFVVPMGIITGIWILCENVLLSEKQIMGLVSIGVGLFVVILACFFIQITISQSRWSNNHEKNLLQISDFSKLKLIVDVWQIITGAMIVLFISLVFANIILPLTRAGHPVYPSLLLCIVICVFYASSCFLFKYYIRISKNENSFLTNPPYEKLHRNVAINEFLYVLPFAVFPLAVGIFHFTTKNSRPLCTTTEMLVFSICWLYVWGLNVKSGQKRKRRIAFLAISQFVILFAIRMYVSLY